MKYFMLMYYREFVVYVIYTYFIPYNRVSLLFLAYTWLEALDWHGRGCYSYFDIYIQYSMDFMFLCFYNQNSSCFVVISSFFTQRRVRNTQDVVNMDNIWVCSCNSILMLFWFWYGGMEMVKTGVMQMNLSKSNENTRASVFVLYFFLCFTCDTCLVMHFKSKKPPFCLFIVHFDLIQFNCVFVNLMLKNS